MFRGFLVVLALTLPTQSFAVINQAVEDACQSEYLTYCMGMPIPSQALRACFRGHMMQLGPVCLKALVDNQEATKADVEKYMVATRKTK
jgi:hypothetical protein